MSAKPLASFVGLLKNNFLFFLSRNNPRYQSRERENAFENANGRAEERSRSPHDGEGCQTIHEDIHA